MIRCVNKNNLEIEVTEVLNGVNRFPNCFLVIQRHHNGNQRNGGYFFCHALNAMITSERNASGNLRRPN